MVDHLLSMWEVLGWIHGTTTTSKRKIALYSEVIKTQQNKNCLLDSFYKRNQSYKWDEFALHSCGGHAQLIHVHICLGVYVEFRRQPVGVASLLPPCRAPVIRLVWCQAPISAELPCQPEFAFGIQNLNILDKVDPASC